jgi:hypothetical protein
LLPYAATIWYLPAEASENALTVTAHVCAVPAGRPLAAAHIRLRRIRPQDEQLHDLALPAYGDEHVPEESTATPSG